MLQRNKTAAQAVLALACRHDYHEMLLAWEDNR